MRSYFYSRKRSRRHGVALVIVLSLVVLLTVMVVAFFSRSILNRQVADTSASEMKADNVARAALDLITTDLRQEINAGSKADGDPSGAVYTVNSVRIFVPKTNKSVVPARIGTDDLLPNLVRRSVRSTDPTKPEEFPLQSTVFAPANFDASLVPKNRGSFVSTTAPSQNQRSISLDRWNKPLLLGPSVPAQFSAPDWVIVTRNGPKVFTAWSAALKDSSRSNQDYAVGRYAYTIYDEGGLLDINLAGYPASLNADDDFKANRGRLGQVNLNDIPGISNGSALVAWRNAQTGSSASAYRSYLFDNTPVNNGFLKTLPNDQTLLSRQDLINYQRQNPANLSSDSLQYLTTYTREKNGPTFAPDAVRQRVQQGKSHPPQSGFTDFDRLVSDDPGNPYTFGQDDLFNPSLLLTKDNGGANITPFSRRFPLSRISMLTASGPAASASAADVKKYFGLVWDFSTGSWIYTSPDGSTMTDRIKFLKNIGNRDPDFFETLQASIHLGSLGRDSDGKQYYNTDYEPGTSSTGRAEAQNAYYQIIQIGANIIDQADSDGYPTVVQFGSDTFGGIENLPYLTRVFNYIYPFGVEIRGEYQFEVWNPHQNTTAAGGGPTELRIFGLLGGAQLEINGDLAPPTNISGLSVNFPYSSSNDYRSPTRLNGGMLFGIYTGTKTNPAFVRGFPSSTFGLQYKGPDNIWRNYQKLRNLEWQIKPSLRNGSNFAEWFNGRVDPRTDRFGTSMNYLPGDPPTGSFRSTVPAGSTLRPDASNGFYLSENSPFAGGIFKYAGGQNSISGAQNSTLGVLSENQSGNPVYYLDTDGVSRSGDGAYRSSLDGQPMATNNAPSRPIILNRPFRSVGELGYVFRDLPWRSIDFMTPASGDLALLDSFAIDDSTIVSGRVNASTRQWQVLATLLSGAVKQFSTPVGPSGTITKAEAEAIAKDLVAFTTNTTDSTKGPLLNRTELLSKFGPNISYSSGGTMAIKSQREAAIRVLAETSNTRTWNLIIDVVAQSGRFTSSAVSLDKFTVEGERRYWLHLAIDRYTGTIIDQRLESVYE